MSVIIKRRRPTVNPGQVANDAAHRAPTVWAHTRAMQYWNSMNTYDYETFKQMQRTAPRNHTWIACWPDSVAHMLNALHPEIFNDTTGKAMEKFLATDEGKPYRVRRS